MVLIPAKMPFFIKKSFPNYVWDFSSEVAKTPKKTLYLTFDDGPTPDITEFVIDQLDQYKAKASFFCIGNNIEPHQDIFKKLIEHGHTIGNHTLRHIKGWKTETNVYIEDTLKAQDIIEANTHKPLTQKLFRPPYGQIKRSQGRHLIDLGYKIIMWDIVAKDWLPTITEEECLQNIISNTVNGSIIVLHDSVKASKNVKYVLPRLLDHFSGKGFEFSTIEV